MSFIKTLPNSQSGDIAWTMANQQRAQRPATWRMPNGGGWANQQMLDQRAAAAGQPGVGFWRPGYLNTPATPYPNNPFAGGGSGFGPDHRPKISRGGGGGGGFAMPVANAYEPSMTMGAGAYWPGHQAEFQQQMQRALLGIAGGPHGETMGQPALMAAALAKQRSSPNPWARLQAGGSYASRPSGGASGGGSLAEGYQNAADTARQMTEARFYDTMSGYQDRYERNMRALAETSDQQKKDTDLAYDAAGAARRQQLIGRGMGNSTVMSTMDMGNERERVAAQNRLKDSLIDRQIALDAQLSGDVLGPLERRNDIPPDSNQAIQLAQMLGQSGATTPQRSAATPQAYQVSLGVAGGGGGFAMPYSMPAFNLGGGQQGPTRHDVGRANVALRNQFIKGVMSSGATEHQARLWFNDPSMRASWMQTLRAAGQG